MASLSIDRASNLAVSILLHHKTSQDNAQCVAKALISAQIDQQYGHGLSRLPIYAAQAACGKVQGHSTPVIASSKTSAIRIDARGGFAYPAMALAVEQLTTLAKQFPIAGATIFRSHHCGQAGYHAEQLANHGLIGIVFSNAPAAIAPWGGHQALFGTNPIAFAAPRPDSQALLIDLGLSKVARGKVMLAKQQAKAIPPDWALDSDGKPTTDANAALAGTMLPIGDAKGTVLALMVELLAAGLSGANFGFEASSFFDCEGGPVGVGQTILAIDPDFFSTGQFAHRLEQLLSAISNQKNTRIPGQNRATLRVAAKKNGLFIDDELLGQLTTLNKPLASVK